MAKSAWEHFKSRAKRSGGLSPWEDAVVAVLATAIGYLILDRKSARENAVAALVIGLGAAIAWQILRFIWRFVWTVPMEVEEERDDALARLEVKTGIPPYHPKIVLNRYGKQGNTYGFFVSNDGYPAYQISIPDVLIGATNSKLTFGQTVPRLIDRQPEQFFEAWIEYSDGTGHDAGGLRLYMTVSDTSSLLVGVIYHDGEYNKDGEFNWYRSNFKVERDASAEHGFAITIVSQELIQKPIAA